MPLESNKEMVKITIENNFDGTILYAKQDRSRREGVKKEKVSAINNDSSAGKNKKRRKQTEKPQIILDTKSSGKKKTNPNLIMLLRKKGEKKNSSKSKVKKNSNSSSQFIQQINYSHRSPFKPKENQTLQNSNITPSINHIRSPKAFRHQNTQGSSRGIKFDMRHILEKSMKLEGRGSGLLSINYSGLVGRSPSKKLKKSNGLRSSNFSRSPNTSRPTLRASEPRQKTPNIFIRNSTFVNQLISNLVAERSPSPPQVVSPKPEFYRLNTQIQPKLKKKAFTPSKNISLKSLVTDKSMKKQPDNEYLIINNMHERKENPKKKQKLQNKVFQILRNIIKE